MMNFGNAIMQALAKGFNLLGDMFIKLIIFLSKPLSYIYYFFEGIFYFVFQLFNVVVKIVMVFGAIIQFFISIVAGFFRTIIKFLSFNYDSTPIIYPSDSYQGIKVVMDFVRPMGLLTVVPLIVLCMLWLFFVKKMIGLIGGGGTSSD